MEGRQCGTRRVETLHYITRDRSTEWHFVLGHKALAAVVGGKSSMNLDIVILHTCVYGPNSVS